MGMKKAPAPHGRSLGEGAGRRLGRARIRPPDGLRVGAVRVAQRVCAQIVGDVHTASHKPARRRPAFRLVCLTAATATSVSCSVLRVALCRVPSRDAEPVTKT